jgi:hypothetical protein
MAGLVGHRVGYRPLSRLRRQLPARRGAARIGAGEKVGPQGDRRDRHAASFRCRSESPEIKASFLACDHPFHCRSRAIASERLWKGSA